MAPFNNAERVKKVKVLGDGVAARLRGADADVEAQAPRHPRPLRRRDRVVLRAVGSRLTSPDATNRSSALASSSLLGLAAGAAGTTAVRTRRSATPSTRCPSRSATATTSTTRSRRSRTTSPTPPPRASSSTPSKTSPTPTSDEDNDQADLADEVQDELGDFAEECEIDDDEFAVAPTTTERPRPSRRTTTTTDGGAGRRRRCRPTERRPRRPRPQRGARRHRRRVRRSRRRLLQRRHGGVRHALRHDAGRLDRRGLRRHLRRPHRRGRRPAERAARRSSPGRSRSRPRSSTRRRPRRASAATWSPATTCSAPRGRLPRRDSTAPSAAAASRPPPPSASTSSATSPSSEPNVRWLWGPEPPKPPPVLTMHDRFRVGAGRNAAVGPPPA